MKIQNLLLLSVICFILVDGYLAESSDENTRGWQPADPKSQHVIALAEFAITEHNREAKDNLRLDHVDRAWTQIVNAGINYKLIIAASETLKVPTGGGPGPVMPIIYFEAVVLEKLWDLTSFQPFLEN